MQTDIHHIEVVDSHTGGEPTRVVLEGGPDLGGGSLAERRERFRARYDRFRTAIVCEPRGSDVLVGALLVEPANTSCTTGVIFFNNVSYLGMCGHGAIGVVATLAHLGRLTTGEHQLDTPVGVVTARLHENGDVSIRNVPSYRFAKDLSVQVEGHDMVIGDVAWGGNWFFLVKEHQQTLDLANVEALTDFTQRIREALHRDGIGGEKGQEIDHVELFTLSSLPGVQSKNFVLCPGKAYDRSPCGTGSSAKLACLYADGKLQEGEVYRLESITGSIFEGTVEAVEGAVIPTIRGRAFVTAEATLVLNPEDPCCWGIGTG